MRREDFDRFGYPVRAIQIAGGSEFKAVFERAGQALGLQLFVLPPRSPKLNGHVERAHRTHQEELYDLVEVPESWPSTMPGSRNGRRFPIRSAPTRRWGI